MRVYDNSDYVSKISGYNRLVRDLLCAGLSVKSEIVGEIIGWFDMELLNHTTGLSLYLGTIIYSEFLMFFPI